MSYETMPYDTARSRIRFLYGAYLTMMVVTVGLVVSGFLPWFTLRWGDEADLSHALKVPAIFLMWAFAYGMWSTPTSAKLRRSFIMAGLFVTLVAFASTALSGTVSFMGDFSGY